ncbi:ABC-type polysaccharide/polyol phosphate export permease [Bradyrhizobium sp. USDA 4354]
MPETLEVLLWCAALATWLMLFFGIMAERLKPLSRFLGHLLQVAFRLRAK